MGRTRVLSIMVFILASLFILTVINCERQQLFEDTSFKKIMEPLIKLEQSFGKITERQVEVHDDSSNMTLILRDYMNRRNFVKKNEKKWLEVAQELKEYINKYPQGTWADDAALCLAMEYFTISLPGNLYTEEAIKAGRAYLADFPDGKLEDWTKQNVPSFGPILYAQNEGDYEDYTEKERIEETIYIHIVKEIYWSKGELAAEKEIKNLEKKGINKKFIDHIRMFLNVYKTADGYWKK